MKPRLNFNCPEKWEDMKIGLVSRYCENCQKDVQDFTKRTRNELLIYLLKNQDKKICGRILKSQLDYTHQDVLITIESYLKKDRTSNIAFYLLAIGALTLLGCSNESRNIDSNEPVLKLDSLVYVTSSNDTGIQTDSNPNVLNQKGCSEDIILPDEFPELMGEIIIDYTDTSGYAGKVPLIVDVMPEYIGGIDSLFSFLKANLDYPNWEKENKIQGTVYVSFVVEKNGEITEPKILKTVEKAENFDQEVIRVIELMPAWKPGKHKGKKVAVQYTLPIKFSM